MRTSPKEMEVHSWDNPLSIYQWHFLLERILPIFILNLSSLIPITVVHGWWMVKSCWIPLFLLANWGKKWPALRGATVEHWHGGGPRVSPATENCCRGDFGLIPKRVNFDPNFACKSCWSLGKKNWLIQNGEDQFIETTVAGSVDFQGSSWPIWALGWRKSTASGQRLHSYGKSPCLMGKSTINGLISIAILT